jgi:hypothetical protein
VTVDIKPAQGAQSVTGEEPVGGVDIVQVIHETERSVAPHFAVALQIIDGLNSEAPDVIRAGLVTAIKVLGEIVCG